MFTIGGFFEKNLSLNCRNFSIGGHCNDYKLDISGYSGTAGDAMAVHNEKKFTTKDHDVDISSGNCAQVYKGAWWFEKCHFAHLNGQYQKEKVPYGTGLTWYHWKGYYYSLKFVEMKIRPST